MKRFLSILIALALLVGMLSLTSVAFAEEPSAGDTPAADRVTFDPDAFKSTVIDQDIDDDGKGDGISFWAEASKTFSFENKWWKDAQKVHNIFKGINYRMQPEQDIEGKEDNYTFKVDFANPAEGDPYTEAPLPTDKEYKETEQVTLPSAPAPKMHKELVEEPAEGEDTEKDVPNAYFAGWQITADDGTDLPIHLQGTFAAGAKIAMPATNITATAVWKETQEKADNEVKPDDVIYLLYVTPSGSYTEDMEKWSSHTLTSTFNLTTLGTWHFRFAVVDGAKASKSSYSFDYDDVIATTFDNVLDMIDEGGYTDLQLAEANCTLVYEIKDTTAPTIELSTTQKNKVEEGLTVGTTYSISTSLDIDDCSATSSNVTYEVYKYVGDAEGAKDGWLLIYDSSTREVTEGYEYKSDGSNPKGCISTSGVITPLAEDVTDKAMYRIVYSIYDAVSGKYGVKPVEDGEDPSTEEYHPTMELKVRANPVNPAQNKAIEAWKIVLYVIAGLSAVGIIVLLCIKPKQQTADARYNASAAEGTDSQEDAADDAAEQADDAKNDDVE